MTKEVMQQALEVLKSKDTCGSSIREAKEDAIKALEEALETKTQAEQHMSKEAMTLALEALENVIRYGSLTGDDFVFDQVDEATTSLRQAIADAEKQEPEPVGSVVKWIDGSLIHGWFGEPPPEGTLLYTHPQPKLETKDEPVPWEQFYPDMGKPQIAFNAEVVGYVAPQQEAKDEPVAWYCKEGLKRGVSLKQESPEWTPLYTTTQRTWVGLTDEEIETIYAECNVWDKFEYERMLEAKLKEKNNAT